MKSVVWIKYSKTILKLRKFRSQKEHFSILVIEKAPINYKNSNSK